MSDFNMDNVRPLTHKVLLRMVNQRVEKIGSIHVPVNTGVQLKTYDIGFVIAIGDTAFSYAPKSKELCKVGDKVFIVKHAGVVLAENAGYSHRPVDDQVIFRLVNDEDILGVEVENE